MGGMLASTGVAIFLIPLTFYVVVKVAHRGAAPRERVPGSPAGPPS